MERANSFVSASCCWDRLLQARSKCGGKNTILTAVQTKYGWWDHQGADRRSILGNDGYSMGSRLALMAHSIQHLYKMIAQFIAY